MVQGLRSAYGRGIYRLLPLLASVIWPTMYRSLLDIALLDKRTLLSRFCPSRRGIGPIEKKENHAFFEFSTDRLVEKGSRMCCITEATPVFLARRRGGSI